MFRVNQSSNFSIGLSVCLMGVFLAQPAFPFGGGKPKPKPTPTVRSASFTVDPASASAKLRFDDGTPEVTATGTGHQTFAIPSGATSGWGGNLHVEAEGYAPYDGRVIIPAGNTEWPAITLTPNATATKRHGVVHAEGRNFVDDDGAFYPLGGTLFWALNGWKFDRDRVRQNLEYLAKNHYDYVRILGEVTWANKPIDPNWGDYEQILGEFLDEAYDTYGLRTELTMIGGGENLDTMALAQKVTRVIQNGRHHKILNLEVANESYQRPLSLDTMRGLGRYLMQNLPNLVALSSGEGLGSYTTVDENWRSEYQRIFMPAGAANLGTVHMERNQGDLGWRVTRQPYDWKELPFPMSHNEPIGPRSSIAEEMDLVRLTTLRAVGLIEGVGAFILHNASGVVGEVDAARNRPANLWEVPGIDDVMAAVRNLDTMMPARASDGQHWNNGWAGCPWNTDSFWTEGADHGVNRNYSVSTPDGWISVDSGVKNFAVFVAARHSRVEIFDILQGKVQEVELQAGQSHTLTPLSQDSHGYGSYIIIGHYL